MKTPLLINSDDYPSFYQPYVSKVQEAYDDNPWQAFRVQAEEIPALLQDVGEEMPGYRYAEGKWTVQQVVGHMIDAERIFGVRCLHWARGEKQALIGFDENEYVQAAQFENRTFPSLLEEFRLVRLGHVNMFEGFAAEWYDHKGEANGSTFSLAAMPYIMVGHVLHHFRILRERYGIGHS